MIYCIGGVSGSGKSTLIRNHPELTDLPHFDIADAYDDAEEYGYRITPHEALDELLEKAREYLDYHQGQSIVLEAFFKPNSEQRRRVIRLAEQYYQDVTFVWCYASRRQCQRRVRRQQGDSARRRSTRLWLINRSSIDLFQPIYGEEPDQVLDSRGYCANCGHFEELEGPDYRYCEDCMPEDYVYDSDNDNMY